MAVEDPHEESIKVCCRFRPENQLERDHGCRICVECPDDGTSVHLLGSDHTFVFDRVFRWDANQKEVYDYAAKPIITSVLRGFNGTVFAYGQTSSGKTYTMEGDIEDKMYQGVIPRMVWSIFDGIYHADEHIEFLVKVSIVEIYNDRIRDLLDPKKDNLKVHEDKARGVFIGEVTESYVGCEQEIFDAMRAGHFNRSMAVTNMNEHSSRSHLIFMLTVEQKNLHDRSVKVGKLHLVDLAGSEKVAKTGASGERLDEAKNINRSLSALGNVINALTDKKYTHVPYRDSKLTRVLQESLGGNAKTSLIITCSPSNFNEQETLSTLRFGQRAKMIKNVVKVNHERSAEELKLLLEKKDLQLNEMSAKFAYFVNLLRAHNIPVPEADTHGLADVAAQQSQEHVAELMDQLQDYREQLRIKAEQVSEFNRERDEVRLQLRTSDGDRERLLSELSEARDEREQLEYERNEKAGEVTRLTAENQRLRMELQAVNGVQAYLDDAFVSPDGGTGASSGASSTTGGVHRASSSAGGAAARGPPGSPGSSGGVGAARHAGVGVQGGAFFVPMGAPGNVDPGGLLQDLSVTPRDERFAPPGRELVPRDDRQMQPPREDRQAQPRDDRHVKRKVSQLDKNLEQLTVMYHKLVAQNSGLKVEVSEADKKAQKKDARINQLETNVREWKAKAREEESKVREAKQKYEKLLAQCAGLASVVDRMPQDSMDRQLRSPDGNGSQQARRHNIMKPLKGGISSARPEAEVGGGYPPVESSPSASPQRRRESSRTRIVGAVRAPATSYAYS